ncbi:MAG TPA: hemolysin family protein [Planctomycetota bacterium]|nr:hemolysin family protein [Planctomycetota bacterium]
MPDDDWSGRPLAFLAFDPALRDVVLWTAGLLLAATVAAESALRNYRRNRLERLVLPGARLARVDAAERRVRALLDALLTLRLAATFAVVVAASWDAVAGGRLGDAATRLGITLFVLLTVVYGTVQRAVRAHPERALLLLLPFVRAVDVASFPARILWTKAADALASIFGVAREPADEEEEFRDNVLDAAAEGERDGVLEEEEREMIENVIAFKDHAVTAVMTPRTRIVSIAVDLSFEEAVKAATESGHSRIPVHDGTVDRIVGLLFVKDLLKHWGRPAYEQPELRAIMRQVPFVPETKPISELLREFQSGMVHMAIVLDEYGGTAGLVTIEDLVEEIVGEIHDELDQEEAAAPDLMVLKSEREADVSALVHIDDLNQALKLSLPEDDSYDTLGGFLFSRMGRIPQRGETYEHDKVSFEILEADDRSIRRVRVLAAEA